uniref:Uncharacterized protein n=1 Tax=Tetranychus urticae TaxID=32264 RepID=T1KQM4_TETUR
MAANKTPYENSQEQQLTIKTYILQSAASTQDFWLTDGKTAYLYRCEVTDSKSSSLVENNPIRRWKSIKKAYLVPQIQDGSAIMGCSWLISQYNTDWPLNENGKPVDLINNPYSLVFGSIDGVYSNKHADKSLIPIYQLQYLYEECKQKTKICYGSNDCVKSASCSELLIITAREYDAIYIDFMFLILVPQEQTSYVIDIKPLPRILKDGNGQNETLLNRLILRTYCDQNICRHKAVFHDFLEIVLDENVLTYSSSHVTGSVRKFIWSLPMIFELNGTLFNCKDTMYKVAIKSSDGLVLAESKSSGLPGYSLREDVFKECTMIKLSSDERGSSAVCYGFNKNDPTSGCLKCSSCSVVAILKPLLTTISNENAVEREELELQLYAQEDTSSFGLFFDYNPDLELSFGYQCLNGEKDGRDDQSVTESTTADESYGQVVNQNGLVAYGSVFCKFIISGKFVGN